MDILLTINGTTGFTFNDDILPAESNSVAYDDVTTNIVNTSSKYVFGYLEYKYGPNDRLASQDGKAYIVSLAPSEEIQKTDYDAWISDAEGAPTAVYFVGIATSDQAISLNDYLLTYKHLDSAATNPISIDVVWTGSGFIPAPSDMTFYSNFTVPPNFNVVDRSSIIPTAGQLNLEVTQDALEAGYDGFNINHIFEYLDSQGYYQYSVRLKKISNNYMVLVAMKQDGGEVAVIQVWDISNTSSPELKSSRTILNLGSVNVEAYITKIQQLNSYIMFQILVHNGNGHLFTYNVADPLNIEETAHIIDGNMDALYAGVSCLLGSNFIIAYTNTSLCSYDMSDPTNPVMNGSPSNINNLYAVDSFFHNGYLFVADLDATLRVFNVSNPSFITEVASYTYSTEALATKRIPKIVIIDNYAYVSNTFSISSQNTGKCFKIDISDPTNPQVVDSKDIRVSSSHVMMLLNLFNYGKALLLAVYNTDTSTDTFKIIRIDGGDFTLDTHDYGLPVNRRILPTLSSDLAQLNETDMAYPVVVSSSSATRGIVISRVVDLAIKDKLLAFDLANDTTSLDTLNDVSWLDSWGSDGRIIIKNVTYVENTRTLAKLKIMGEDYVYSIYTNSSFPIDTIQIPVNAFTNLGLKNVGNVRIKGYLDILYDDGNGNLSRSSLDHYVYNVDLFPGGELSGDGIVWWLNNYTDASHIPVKVIFVAEDVGVPSTTPSYLYTNATHTVGFQYDASTIPSDSSALSLSQITSDILNNDNVVLTGYFDAEYYDNGVLKKASEEGNQLDVTFDAQSAYPLAQFQNWINTFPESPISIWYHLGTLQNVTPVTPPVVLTASNDGSVTMEFDINAVPIATNRIDISDINSDITNTSSGYFNGYFDYVYNDGTQERLASDDGNELEAAFTPGSSFPLADINNWLSNAPQTPTELFFYVREYSATDPNAGTPPAPPFEFQLPVVRRYTDGTTPDEVADSAGYGTTTYAPIEYYPANQTVTQRYYVTSSPATISGLDPNTDYRLVVIGDTVENITFTTDNNGTASVVIPEVAITNGTITTNIYDANNNPIDICLNPQYIADTVRVMFVRADDWVFYGTLSLINGEVSSNAELMPGIYTKIIIRSQMTGKLIPKDTVFKLIKPGFSHADLNAFLFSHKTLKHTRQLEIPLDNVAFPNMSSQDWEVLINRTVILPCGDTLSPEDIQDTYLDAWLVNQTDGGNSFGIPGYIDVDPTQDTDGDGITDLEEDAPDTDTDGDGIEDYKDSDSDNDGISDAIEGTIDADNDGIRAFQDQDEGPDRVYNVTVPNEMVPMLNYTIVFDYQAHVRLPDRNAHITITADNVFNLEKQEFDLEPCNNHTVKIMLSAPNSDPCAPVFPENPLHITITAVFKDINGDEITQTDTFDINYVAENLQYPYKGNKITWIKVDNAVKYYILRKQPGESNFTTLDEVLNNGACSCDTQYYLDRTGSYQSFYQIVAVLADGTTVGPSKAMCSDAYTYDTCTIHGNVVNLAGKPIVNAVVSARMVKAPIAKGSLVIYKYTQNVLTSELGGFSIAVPKGSTILLTIDDVGMREELVVPNEDAILLSDLLIFNKKDYVF